MTYYNVKFTKIKNHKNFFIRWVGPSLSSIFKSTNVSRTQMIFQLLFIVFILVVSLFLAHGFTKRDASFFVCGVICGCAMCYHFISQTISETQTVVGIALTTYLGMEYFLSTYMKPIPTWGKYFVSYAFAEVVYFSMDNLYSDISDYYITWVQPPPPPTNYGISF